MPSLPLNSKNPEDAMKEVEELQRSLEEAGFQVNNHGIVPEDWEPSPTAQRDQFHLRGILEALYCMLEFLDVGDKELAEFLAKFPDLNESIGFFTNKFASPNFDFYKTNGAWDGEKWLDMNRDYFDEMVKHIADSFPCSTDDEKRDVLHLVMAASNVYYKELLKDKN